MTRPPLRVLPWLLAALVGVAGRAQESFEFWPGVGYDPSIPTIESVLGYGPGDGIASHAELMEYLRALAAAAPDRVRFAEYAESWEGRPLAYVMVGSAANIARLDAVESGMQRLGNPVATSDTEARALIASLPAIAWLSYGVHGNEVSSPNAALLTAYHLTAAVDDPTVDEILAGAIVAIDPTQNPDGRDRFVHHYRMTTGIEPAASPIAAEHDEPWPGGRTNHYYFDLNRDWFALTQPEVRGRVKTLQRFYPVVHVDLHEMGANATYYFAPAADPYNPHLTAEQRENLTLFGRGNAFWFDRFGFDYFTREVYDAFYPGYGDSWPMFLGAAGMTYEQASARGLVVRRNDGTTLRFVDGVRRHFVASIATAQTAARHREALLSHLYELRRSAIEDVSEETVQAYILPLRGDRSAVRKLAGVLVEQGIDVRQSAEVLQACGEEYPAGSFVVPLAQPSRRLAATLLSADNPFEPAFVEEQERRRRKNLSAEIYDVTAWSLPLLYNVECVPCSTAPAGDLSAVGPERIVAGTIEGGVAEVAYLVPWGSAAAARFLAAALDANIRVLSSDEAFRQGEREYPRGTLIIKAGDGGSDLHTTLERLAASSGASITATNTSWVDEGVNFGSGSVATVRPLSIGLAWDRPTSASAAGATRFVLERQFGYPVTPVRTTQLARADLSRFDVIILPDGTNYQSVLGSDGTRRLADWVGDGGTLIGLKGAMSLLADPEAALLDVRRENLAPESTDGGEDDEERGDADAERVAGRLLTSEADYLAAIQGEDVLPDDVPGVIVRARVDPDHWITAGLPEIVHVMLEGRDVYTPITLDHGVNAVTFLGPDELLASGYLWEENRRQLAYKPFVIVQARGRGLVVGFTADPNFRAFADGLNVLFLNAVFRGPSHGNP